MWWILTQTHSAVPMTLTLLPKCTSELITQALIWDNVVVLSEEDSWYKIKLNDGYQGWINKFYTTVPRSI